MFERNSELVTWLIEQIDKETHPEFYKFIYSDRVHILQMRVHVMPKSFSVFLEMSINGTMTVYETDIPKKLVSRAGRELYD